MYRNFKLKQITMLITPIQIRFNDIDGFGHVNNSVYNQYLDLGKIHFFQKTFGPAFFNGKKAFVLVHIDMDFLKPTVLTDVVHVTTEVGELFEKSFALKQQIVGSDGEIKVQSNSILSTFDIEQACSFEMPQDWLKILQNNRLTE